MNVDLQRRKLLSFLGYSAALGASSPVFGKIPAAESFIHGISPSRQDDLRLAEGLAYDIVIRWQDRINAHEAFGFNNDFIALLQEEGHHGVLWVNHEYVHPLFIGGSERSRKNIDLERAAVGGSVLRIEKKGARWQLIKNDPINKRIDATTNIPFTHNAVIKGSNIAEGTVGNCAGGITSWGTFLSCEENYDLFYGEREFQTKKRSKSRFKWEQFYPNPPEHYGWVVEVDPTMGTAKKHISLGRFSHESATCVVSKRGHTVVYMGDDKNDECLYKFVTDQKNTLTSGTLFVADIDNGKWLPLDRHQNQLLQKHFTDQVELCTYTRQAAKLVGGTPLDRPEDIKINPITGDIFISLTNNVPRANFHGQILKISEYKQDFEATEFTSDIFLTGGDSGFSCPDNLLFDRNGNLWFCSDISGKAIHTTPYAQFQNNGLYIVPARGPQAGMVVQIASAPHDAELTGLCFDAAQTTLFLSVQHPGETSKNLNQLTSHWPNQQGLPASAVVQIHGPLLETFTKHN